MKTRRMRILGAALAALLPACGGGGNGSSSTSTGGSGNPAFPVTMTEPSAGQTFTAPATVSLNAVAADPANVTMVEFFEATPSEPLPNAFSGGGKVVATSTQPPFQAIWADAPAGIHSFVARMTDKLGAQTFSNSVTISVLAPGESPGGWMPVASVQNLPGGLGMIWFVDADRGWIAGNQTTIMHTVDGGASWVVQFGGHPTGMNGPRISQMQFVDAERGWAVGYDRFGHQFDHNDGMLLRTTDGGATWTSSSVGPSSGLSALSFVDEDVGWVVGSSGPDNVNNVFATKDGGITWSPLPTGIPGIVSIDAVHFVDRQSGWVVGSVVTPEGSPLGVILHTADGGLTWSEQLRAGPNELFGPPEFVNPTTGWVSRVHFSTPADPVQNGGILFTNDGGATWTEQTVPGSEGIFALEFVSPKQGWGGGSSGIIHTDDGGASWVTQQGTETPFGPGFDVQFINANVGWALRGDGILFKTTTGGKSP